jgi:hypothetical protein
MSMWYKSAQPWLPLAIIAAAAMVALGLWGVARYIRADLDGPGPPPARKADKRGR